MVQYLILFFLILFAVIIGLNIGNWLRRLKKYKSSNDQKKA